MHVQQGLGRAVALIAAVGDTFFAKLCAVPSAGGSAPARARGGRLQHSCISTMPPGVPDKVVLHPLVLLSVVDHYNRVAKDTKKRIVGVLLGEAIKGQVDVTNSFAGGWRWALPMRPEPVQLLHAARRC